MPPEICPHCGAEIPPRAKACPACGSDEETGWSDGSYTPDLGIPEENFDYDDYVKKEFSPTVKPHGLAWIWWATAILLLVLLIFFFFH